MTYQLISDEMYPVDTPKYRFIIFEKDGLWYLRCF